MRSTREREPVTKKENPMTDNQTPTDTLWAVYVAGADEYRAASSREDAEQQKEELDAFDRGHAVLTGAGARLSAEVRPWPFDAESHAAELAEADHECGPDGG
jgi:hypothetical protein